MAEQNNSSGNTFANDGSFMELFKKKMEEQKGTKKSEALEKTPEFESTRVLPCPRENEDTPATDTHEASGLDQDRKSVHKPYQVILNMFYSDNTQVRL